MKSREFQKVIGAMWKQLAPEEKARWDKTRADMVSKYKMTVANAGV